MVKDVAANGTIKNAKGKTIATMDFKHGTISPQAKFGLVFRNYDQTLPKGDYVLNLKVTDADHHVWNIKQKIKINEKKHTSVPVKVTTEGIPYGLIFGIIGGVLLLGLLIFLCVKYREFQKT